MRVYTVQVVGVGQGPTFGDIADLLAHLRDDFEGAGIGDTILVEVAEGRPVYTHAPDCAYTLARALFAPPWRTQEKEGE